MSYLVRDQSEYSGEPIELYEFTSGETIYRYTNGDEDIVYNTYTYSAIPIERSAPVQSKESAQSKIRINMPRDSSVPQIFVNISPSNTVWVTILRYHRNDSEVITYWQGRVRGVVWTLSKCELECEPQDAMLKRMALWRTYQNVCNHALYSAQCGVQANANKFPVVIGTVSDTTITSSDLSAITSGWLTAGFIKRRTPDAQQRFISSHSGNTITILQAFDGLQVGETVDVFAGCLRDYGTCRTKFNNGDNYGGFPYVPTRNPFTNELR
jgi:uncharacterized phage protein (TIGR02218 family)